MIAAATHQPTATSASVVSASRVAPRIETTASAVPEPPKSSTAIRRKSRKRLSFRPGPRGRAANPRTPSTAMSARSTIAAGPSSERTPTRTAASRSPLSMRASSASKASRSVASSPPYRAVRTGRVLDHQVAHPPGPCRPGPAGGSRAPCAPSGGEARESRPPVRAPRSRVARCPRRARRASGRH